MELTYKSRFDGEKMKVVITGIYPETTKKRIERCFPEDWEIRIVLPEKAEDELRTADVLIPEHVPVNGELLKKAPMLKLVQTGAGYDNVNLEECTKYGVQVCNASNINADAVAEHVMAFILCWYKNLIYLDGFMKAHRNEEELEYSGAELSEKTIGIIGMGMIGRAVARYCQAFGMRVLGYSRKDFQIDAVESRPLDDLYHESDIVSIHVPLTGSTRHMIGKTAFQKMKRDAVLINTSRGSIVDETQLIKAIQDGEIGGACLDVYEDEPLRQDSPLRNLEHVILTPHIAGLPDGVKYHKKRYEFFVSNIKKVMRKEEPECRLNII